MLVMNLQETGKDVYSLPILAKSVVPSITLRTPLLDYGRCFLEYPYTLNAELVNESELPVRYEVPEQEDETILAYSTPSRTGIVEALSTLKLPLEIRPKLQGELSMSVPIRILHCSNSMLSVGISCIGEGPVVYVTPTRLRWGVCPVLTTISKKVTLSNQSVIPAKFQCAFVSVS